jgi:preprotein translocase subunit YajC
MYLLQAQPGGSGFSMIFMGLMILVFWMFFIRPQAKRQKQQKTFGESLQPGDRVVTVAGIHGKINRINEDGTVNLEISPGSYIKMERSSISMEMSQALNKPVVTTEKK